MDEQDDRARDLLRTAARRLGWPVLEGSYDQVVADCYRQVAGIRGGQDRTHATRGIRAAIEAARAGRESEIVAGLNEAKKTLEVHRYNWEGLWSHAA